MFLKTKSYFCISILLMYPIDGELNIQNDLTLSKPVFFENGRQHNLPTVTIRSEFKIITNKSFGWDLHIPQNITGKNDETFVVLTVTGTFPFHVFYQYPTEYYEENTFKLKSLRIADDVFNDTSIVFEMICSIHWSFKAKNNSIEFRSIHHPFFGISVRYSLNLQNTVLFIGISTSIPDTFKDYFRLMQETRRNESCKAYFFVEQIQDLSSSRHRMGYSCLFANGKSGFARRTNYFADRIVINHVNNGENCWIRRKLCGKNNSCNPLNLPASDEFFSGTSIVTCVPKKFNKDNLKEIASTPIYEALPQPGQHSFPNIYFAKEEVEGQFMIRMEIFEKYQYVDTHILITCLIEESFATYPLRFGVKYRKNHHIKLFNTCSANECQIHLDSLDIESVFCFAPIRGSYEWINASRSISVQEPSRPKFIVNSFVVDNSTVRIDQTVTLGATNESIACVATGFLPPKISWMYNDVLLKSTSEGTFPSPVRRSIIVFVHIGKTMEGIYICRAQNDHGEAQLAFNVITVDDYATSTSFTLPIATTVVAIFAMSLCITVIIWKRMKQQRIPIMAFLTKEEQQQFLNGSPGKKYYDRNAFILTQPFNPNYILTRDKLNFDARNIFGSGQHGIVIQGWMCLDGVTQVQVAIKTTKETTDIFNFKVLLSAIKISSVLNRHPNIVGFFGAFIENINYGEIYAAYEFCHQGDLLAVLRRMKSQLEDSNLKAENLKDCLSVSTENLYKWARDITNGMAFLSSQNVIHGDLSAKNVLLTETNVAKIKDIGLTFNLQSESLDNFNRTQWKWMAPESLTELKYSVHSDVWSFGVTLWEIFSLGDPPYAGLKYSAKFVEDLCQGMRLTKPPLALAAPWIYIVMLQCWEKNPDCRPTISSVGAEIQEFIDNPTTQKETETS